MSIFFAFSEEDNLLAFERDNQNKKAPKRHDFQYKLRKRYSGDLLIAIVKCHQQYFKETIDASDFYDGVACPFDATTSCGAGHPITARFEYNGVKANARIVTLEDEDTITLNFAIIPVQDKSGKSFFFLSE